MRKPLHNTLERVIEKIVQSPHVEGLIKKIVQSTADRVAETLPAQLEGVIETIVQSTADRVAETLPVVTDSITRALAERVYYIVKLHQILESAAGKNHKELFHGINDDYWLWLNTEGSRLSADLRALLPGLPKDKKLEYAAVTLKGEENLLYGFQVYQSFKRIYEKHRGDLSRCDSILDFGCGWGRMIRFFLRDVSPATLWGVDPWKEFIEAARETNKWCHFDTIEPLPPTSFEPGSFGLIYCYSVFSHLSEDVHKRWLAELSRILKPGGLLIATTLGRDHIEWISQLRTPAPTSETDSERLAVNKDAATLFPDHQQALNDYDKGSFCYSAYADYKIAGLPWGDACIPKQYVLKHWGEFANVLEYVEDRQVCDQNVIVATKAV
jgi:SAM-dependent methyltransferase